MKAKRSRRGHTTASAGWDATTAANDEAGTLGDHAETCKEADARLRPVVDALHRAHSSFRPRMITLLVIVFIAAATATLVLS